MLQTSDDSTLINENRPQCLIVSKASNLCEDLLDDDDLIGEHILDIPVTNKVQKNRGKKGLMIRIICGGVLELE
jgi:hypothetical protein